MERLPFHNRDYSPLIVLYMNEISWLRVKETFFVRNPLDSKMFDIEYFRLDGNLTGSNFVNWSLFTTDHTYLKMWEGA